MDTGATDTKTLFGQGRNYLLKVRVSLSWLGSIFWNLGLFDWPAKALKQHFPADPGLKTRLRYVPDNTQTFALAFKIS